MDEFGVTILLTLKLRVVAQSQLQNIEAEKTISTLKKHKQCYMEGQQKANPTFLCLNILSRLSSQPTTTLTKVSFGEQIAILDYVCKKLRVSTLSKDLSFKKEPSDPH